MFGWDQRQRLLRENWQAPALAEEIFAMMSPDTPNNTQAPITVSLPSEATVAPFQIGNFTDGNPVFNFKGRNGVDLGSIVFSTGASPGDGSSGASGDSGGGSTPSLKFKGINGETSDLTSSNSSGTSVPVWG